MPPQSLTYHHRVRFPIGLFHAHEGYLIQNNLTANIAEPLIFHKFLDVYFQVKDGCNLDNEIKKLLDRLDAVAEKSEIEVRHINTISCFAIDLNGDGKNSFPF